MPPASPQSEVTNTPPRPAGAGAEIAESGNTGEYSVPPSLSLDRTESPSSPRLLLLDDDSCRAELFLLDHPGAVWVQTAVSCIERLAEPWDEVHLDHDLGGERYVDPDRSDCGMEVVRWLCAEPREALRETLFVVHSLNAGAAAAMVQCLKDAGFRTEYRPFGYAKLEFLPIDELEAWGHADTAAGESRHWVLPLLEKLSRLNPIRWPRR